MSKIREIMSEDVICLSPDAPVAEAAKKMRDEHVGAIVVKDGDRFAGILTDRDIAVRAVAEGRDPKTTPVSAIHSQQDLATLRPDDDVDRAVHLMRRRSVRRAPVLENGKVIGIVSLGDLAVERDRQSVLGAISAAAPNG
jgi:CBS domain-containing protein